MSASSWLGGPYCRLFESLHQDRLPYYRSWCHEVPMLVSRRRDEELHEIQRILYKCCAFYAGHYTDYLDRVPYEEKILEILEECRSAPFQAGTFRPDYLICGDGGIRVCEITSRFFANAYFLSYFTEHAGMVFAEQAGVTDYRSYFEEMLEYFASMLGSRKRLCVLKSADKSDSIRLYVPFYHALGAQTVILEAEEVESNLELLKDSLVVSALNQKDLQGYSMDTLKRIAAAGTRNDFRTVFLLHDKRFFTLFHEKDFTDRCLSPEEAEFLKAHTVETFVYGERPEIWKAARKDRDGYILKHHWLGKSEKVYAGCLTPPEEWEALFAEGQVKEMILQPFMRQKTFRAECRGEMVEDYIAGTILCVDDRYFGTGLFRTSSRPVINQTDAHKAAQLMSDQSGRFVQPHIL